MKKFNLKGLSLLCGAAFLQTAMAQPTVLKMKDRQALQKEGVPPSFTVAINPKKATQASLHFSDKTSLKITDTRQWLTAQLQLRPGTDQLMATDAPKTYANLQVEKFDQYFRGVKVEHGMAKAATINGKMAVMQLEFYGIANNFSTTPALTEAAALQKAMAYTKAQKFAWENTSDPALLLQKPKAELVIVTDYYHPTDTVCLAYKFKIYADQPMTSALVYVNAMDGQLALLDNQIYNAYTNSPGNATTVFSGPQTIFTDEKSITLNGKPFRLRQSRNGHDIETYDFENDETTVSNMNKHYLLPVDIEDNDNDWTGNDATATEVHFNMQIISDYWKKVHNRNSFDNKNTKIASYVHAKVLPLSAHAFWENQRQCMFFGDGLSEGDGHNTLKNTGPNVGLDITAHEMGHAVANSEDMPRFVQSRESGALNEGFSDIWGVCVENYAVKLFPALAPKKDIWIVGEESIMSHGGKGLRDVKNPALKETPNTYYGTNYADVSKEGCPEGTNDNCGVHVNSSILAKWFSLITEGGTGTNENGYNYTVTGLGFDTTQELVYQVEMMLTPNSDYHSVMNTSINYARAKYGQASIVTTQIAESWRAVGLMDTLFFKTSSIPEFDGVFGGFNCVAVGKNGYVWAGTGREGLFKYNGKEWRKSLNNIENKVNYLDMKADQDGGIWMAQSGYSAGLANPNASGGIYYFSDTTFESKRHYTASADNPPRNTLSANIRAVWVDTSRYNSKAKSRGKDLPQVWAAAFPRIVSDKQTSGGVVVGLSDTVTTHIICSNCPPQPWDSNFIKATTSYMDKVDKRTSQRSAQEVGGDSMEVWVYSDANYEKSLESWGYEPGFYYNGTPRQIMRFNAKTGDSIGVYNSKNIPQLDESFVAKAIYFDVKGNKWIGLVTGGMVVYEKHRYKDVFGIEYIQNRWVKAADINDLDASSPNFPTGSFPKIFPPETIVGNHAITGDSKGNVYFGTNVGLIVYNGSDAKDYRSYKRYTVDDGLPSNNIRGLAIDTLRKGIWLATDNGVTLWRFEGAEHVISINNIRTDKCSRDMMLNINTRGRFASANELSVELSDANGSFANALLLKKISYVVGANTSKDSLLKVELPISVANGPNYQVRVKASQPAFTSLPSRAFRIEKINSIVATAGTQTVSADWECEDEEGWTHYYSGNNTPTIDNDDIRLLSIKKNGNDIGNVTEPGFKVTVGTTVLAGSHTAQVVANPMITNNYVSMNRYWDVTVTNAKQPKSPVGVRFYYNTQDLLDIKGKVQYGPINHNNLIFCKTNGNPNPTSGFSGATFIVSILNGTAPTTTTWVYSPLDGTSHQAEFLVNSFSGGTGGSTANDGPLSDVITPLQLVSFTGQYANGSTNLQWQTANEENTSLFEIERSNDGIAFVKIADKQAAGNGNNSYAITDNNPLAGSQYYRLKMLDKNGDFSYSAVVKITANTQQVFVVRPNPAHNSFQIIGINTIEKLQLTDISGRAIKSFAPQASNRYSIAGIAPGVYMLSGVSGNQVITQKLVIQ